MKSRRVTVPPPIGYSSFFDARGDARAPCADRLRRWDHTTANKFYALSHYAVKLLPRRRAPGACAILRLRDGSLEALLRRDPGRRGVRVAGTDRHRGGHRDLRGAVRRLQRAPHGRRVHEAVDLRRADRPRPPRPRHPGGPLHARHPPIRDARVRRAPVEVQGADQDRRHHPPAREGHRQEGDLEARPRPHHRAADRAQPARRDRAGGRDRPDGRAPAAAMTGSYFEDVPVEAVEETPGLTITSAHVAIYLGLTRELAEDDTAVPDLLPLAFTIGLGWRVPKPPPVVRAFMGIDWQGLGSLRVGDPIKNRGRGVTEGPIGQGRILNAERGGIAHRRGGGPR